MRGRKGGRDAFGKKEGGQLGRRETPFSWREKGGTHGGFSKKKRLECRHRKLILEWRRLYRADCPKNRALTGQGGQCPVQGGDRENTAPHKGNFVFGRGKKLQLGKGCSLMPASPGRKGSELALRESRALKEKKDRAAPLRGR